MIVDCPQNDKEWCVDDQDGQYIEINEDDYILVNLLDNEEKFTGYEGSPVWNTIYEENCVLDQAISNLKPLVNQDRFWQLDNEESCSEATLLYHVMSGLHASVNTHISEGFEDPQTLEISNNKTYFMEKIGDHPNRVKNLHFIYAAVVKAVGLMEQRLIQNDYTTGLKISDDEHAKKLIILLLKNLAEGDCENSFQEKNFFKGKQADIAEKELLSEI